MVELPETPTLTDDERAKLREYAESLIASRRPVQRAVTPEKRRSLNVDGLLGLCKGLGGDKTDKELIREGWDEIVAKYDK